MRGLDRGAWEPWYKDYLDHFGVSEDELGRGAEVLAEYLNAASRQVEENRPEDTLERVGFFDLPAPVQFVIQAKLGQMLLAAYFQGIREVTHLNEEPPLDIRRIVKQAEETAYYMSMHRALRWFVRKWRGFRHWLASKLVKLPAEPDELPRGPNAYVPPALPSTMEQVPVISTEEAPLPTQLPRPGVNPGA